MSLDEMVGTQVGTDVSLDPDVLRTSATYAPVLCLVEYGLEDPGRSRVTGYRGVQLGDVDVFRYEGVGLHRGDRKASHIRADHMDDYLVTIPLRARLGFCQGEQARAVEPGEFALLSTARPFAGSVAGLAPHEMFSALHVRISGAVLRQRLPHVEECCGHVVGLRPGAGVILQRMCEMAITDAGSLSRNEGRQFASMLVDAVVNAAAEAPEILERPILSARWTTVRIGRQAKAYIEHHLSDPDLDTDAVAAHCRVSKRYLQSVFADSGETVVSTIHEMRLCRCREALKSPALRRQTVAQIARHWGFTDLPYFCRSYKSRFQCSPGADRELH